ncbi:MAG: XapX domain-containing protein [Desulfotomaculum sp.]|nr:XapX domain-containing protein [Desulfotomaculum sp.]
MQVEIKELVLALLAGLAVGLLFGKLKLPIPAPPSLSGILGIIGIFLGYLIAVRLGWVR